VELGVISFAEIMPDPKTGSVLSPGQRLKDIIEEIRLADQVGLDVYGLGEHHRRDFAGSSPAIVLAAAASQTSHIRLSSAVTVLSSADPVRTFEDFATLDLISDGRAEIMAGRGAFTESFPLFGFDLADYDELFAEKLDLLLALRRDEPVTWSGKHRPALYEQSVYPRPRQKELPIWVAVGGSPASAARAGSLGLPLALALVAGDSRRLAPLADLYRKTAAAEGHDPSALRLSINSHGYVTDSTRRAVDDTHAYFAAEMRNTMGVPAASLPSPADYEADMALHGGLAAGTPEQVAEKIVYQHGLLRNDRFMMRISLGSMPHADVLRGIERFGTEVAPLVRSALP
jgi:probable LLM family oxidoreductase